jgi:TetR/AcrR family transcriptional repressor of nem operon
MKVTREQAAARRDRSSTWPSELFRAHGFDGVAIAEIMKSAGVTHGELAACFAHENVRHVVVRDATWPIRRRSADRQPFRVERS